MKRRIPFLLLLLAALIGGCASAQESKDTPSPEPEAWVIDTAGEWRRYAADSSGMDLAEGFAAPETSVGVYRSEVVEFDDTRSAATLVVRQSPVWENWEPVDNIGPSNLRDAPVLLVKGPDDYWMFGMYASKRKRSFRPEEVELEGFDIPLTSTLYPNQFDAPGGLEKGLGGYHAWQSKDMVNWVHHGPVTEGFSRWVTTAEYVDGKTYIYYDYPNDQDPHLYIDDDLADGCPGRDMGMAFADPSDGSDCTVIRDLEGRFHLVYEDWSPINARTHSWDSSLAGHAVSDSGKGDFEILPPAIDERTEPTGDMAEYHHSSWTYHPDWDSNLAIYEVHEPEQDSFGDWAAISIGGRYYLFSDYDPADGPVRLAWFTSPSLDEEFTQCGEIGRGHPDPDIGFAEGQFYLVTQWATDYVSPGPWVEKVQARVGVDIDGDGEIDRWTGWQEIEEEYDYVEGFSKQVACTPASLDLSGLPAGLGFCFELWVEDATENESRPLIDSVTLSFGAGQ